MGEESKEIVTDRLTDRSINGREMSREIEIERGEIERSRDREMGEI